MPTILSIQKNEIALKPEDFLETARYLGYNKANPPDEQVMGMIKAACRELFGVVAPKAVFDSFDLTVAVEKGKGRCESDNQEELEQLEDKHAPGKSKISFADVTFYSESLGINLKDCRQVFLVAVTIGPQVDALIRRTQVLDSVKASIMQAAGAMFAEKTIELINAQIKDLAASQNKKCKPRFSPGYGDVPLTIQKDFFRLLPCSKIGLSLMDTLIMSPEKSITAFIGLL